MMKIKSVSELKQVEVNEGTFETYVSSNVLNYMIETKYDFKVLATNEELTLVRIYE